MDEGSVHLTVLGAGFLLAAGLGWLVHRNHFCAMGGVSDWIHFGDSGRLRAWLLAATVALGAVSLMRLLSLIDLEQATFPPYRAPRLVWLRHFLGGLAFGVGMTLASGCANRTLVRAAAGNLKSLVVLASMALTAYLMVWTPAYARFFEPWLLATAIDLESLGYRSQALGMLWFGTPAADAWLGVGLGLAGAAVALAASDLSAHRDKWVSGLGVGLVIAAGWALTAGPLGTAWRDWAAFTAAPPARVVAQSYTFVSPLADLVHYLGAAQDLARINFGMLGMLGVIVGAHLDARARGLFRVEWFADGADAGRHILGGLLMGVGGVLAMGCTIGQAVTGVSTLSLGAFITFPSLILGAAVTMKLQYAWLART